MRRIAPQVICSGQSVDAHSSLNTKDVAREKVSVWARIAPRLILRQIRDLKKLKGRTQ